MHGQGTYIWGDGRIYYGMYSEDKKSGNGMYLWSDGRAFNGEWLDGKQNGFGYYMVTGDDKFEVKKGEWTSGKRKRWLEDITENEIAD